MMEACEKRNLIHLLALLFELLSSCLVFFSCVFCVAQREVLLQTLVYQEQSDQSQSLQPWVVTGAHKCSCFSPGCAHSRDPSELKAAVAPGMLQRVAETTLAMSE